MFSLNKILNNCAEVTAYIVEGKDLSSLPLQKRLEINFHLTICRCCKNFKIQSEKIDSALASYFKSEKDNPTIKLSAEFKQRLEERLK